MKCPYCSGLVLAGDAQKTKGCPYCGKGINLEKALCVAKAASSLEASELLKQLKVKNANNSGSRS
jgi:hypothetical protein